jgi:1-acyl-sn-glycerol-3-phosphate acyltransferase
MKPSEPSVRDPASIARAPDLEPAHETSAPEPRVVHSADPLPRNVDPSGLQSAPLQRGVVAWTRRIVRIGELALITLAISVLWFVGLPFTLRRARRRRAWRKRLFQGWSRAALRICRVHLSVRGELPRGACFFVANHLGYLDILVIEAAFDATFVSMKELEHWPVFGTMARQFGTIFIERGHKRDIPVANEAMRAAIGRGEVVVLFPEGRHSRGTGVLPFRTALLEPAASSASPVAWGVIHYATGPGDPPAARAIPWVGVTFPRQALVMLALGRVEARLDIGSELVRSTDRKHIAAATRAHILARFEPLASK